MSTEDISMVAQVLAGILNPESSIRTQAAEKIIQLSQNLGAITYCLLQVSSLPAQTAQESQVKEIALVLLRRIISKEPLEKWKEINNDLKEQIKNKALQNLEKEVNQKMKNKLIDVFTEIIEKISDADEEWPQLKVLCINLIHQNLNDSTDYATIESILRLFKNSTQFVFEELLSNLDILRNFFTQIFKTDKISLKVVAAECINELISLFGEDEGMEVISPFLFNILQTVLECFNKKNEEESLKRLLEIIIETSSVEPDLFDKHFKDMFVLTLKIVDNKSFKDEKLRELGFEVLINLIEEKPKLLTKNKENFKILLEKIFQYALEFDRNEDEDWCNPNVTNYEEIENVDEDYISFSKGMIERLVECIGVNKISPYLKEIINNLIAQNEWGCKYISLFIISSLAEYEEDMSNLEVCFNVIFSLCKFNNYKVRFAAVNCINKFTVTFNPEFYTKYLDSVLPLLVQLYKNENILRVKCEIMETIDSLIGFASSESLSKYMKDLFEFFFNEFTKDLPILLKKCVIEAILELICTMEDECKPLSEKAFELTYNYFKSIYQNKSNTQFYGALLEIITSLGPYTQTTFYNEVPNIVQIIIEITQNSNFANMPDKLDFQNTIEKLVPILNEKYKNLVPSFIQALFSLINNTPKMSISSSPNSTLDIKTILSNEDDKYNKKIDLGTSEIEDFSSSISLLNSVVETMSSDFLPYAQQAEQLVLPYLKYQFNAKVRSKVAKTLPNLLSIIEDKNTKIIKGKLYIESIVSQIEKETEYKICKKMYIDLQEVINHCEYILSKPELNKLFEQLFNHFKNVEKKRCDLIKKKENNKNNKTEKHADDDDEDDDDINDLIDEDIEALEEIQEEISETIGYMFKTHQKLCDEIVQIIISKVLPVYTLPTASNFESKMALYIVDDMIEYLGQEMLSNIWDNLFELLIKLGTSTIDNIRQAACYGIGIFSKFTNNNFNKYSEKCLFTLREAMKINPDDKDEENWGLAHDNIIASFGKILFIRGDDDTVKKYYNEIMENWINNLPLKNDSSEYEQQHEWLIDSLNNKSNLIPASCLNKAISVAASIYLTKYSNDMVNEKIKFFFNRAKNDDNAKKIIESIYQSCDKKVKNKIKQLIE